MAVLGNSPEIGQWVIYCKGTWGPSAGWHVAQVHSADPPVNHVPYTTYTLLRMDGKKEICWVLDNNRVAAVYHWKPLTPEQVVKVKLGIDISEELNVKA